MVQPHQTDTPEPESSYPKWWDWDSDGDTCSGRFVEAGQGQTEMGKRIFICLDIDRIKRTVWLHNTALEAKFKREVERRPDHELHEGERIWIRRLGERTSRRSERSYIDFQVEFPDGPQVSQADLFGVTMETTATAKPEPVEPEPVEPERSEPGEGDDGIPF